MLAGDWPLAGAWLEVRFICIAVLCRGQESELGRSGPRTSAIPLRDACDDGSLCSDECASRIRSVLGLPRASHERPLEGIGFVVGRLRRCLPAATGVPTPDHWTNQGPRTKMSENRFHCTPSQTFGPFDRTTVAVVWDDIVPVIEFSVSLCPALPPSRSPGSPPHRVALANEIWGGRGAGGSVGADPISKEKAR